jgi:hypothetical protein
VKSNNRVDAEHPFGLAHGIDMHVEELMSLLLRLKSASTRDSGDCSAGLTSVGTHVAP